MSNDEILREFLLETHENLALLDADLLRLEQQPTDAATLAQAFRTLHSVKGTAGFMGLNKLQAISHSAESLLAKLRSGTLVFNRPIATALLKVVDAIREILTHLERDGTEGSGQYAAISAEVDLLQSGQVPEQDHPEPVSTDVPHEKPKPSDQTVSNQTVVDYEREKLAGSAADVAVPDPTQSPVGKSADGVKPTAVADGIDSARTVTTFDPNRTKTSIGAVTLPYLPPITPAEPSHETIPYERLNPSFDQAPSPTSADDAAESVVSARRASATTVFITPLKPAPSAASSPQDSVPLTDEQTVPNSSSHSAVSPPSSTVTPTSSTPTSSTPPAKSLTSNVADTSIRVDVELVDQLMTLVGELVLARNHILQVSAGMEHDGLTNAVQRLSRLTTDLQSSVMKTRMQPIANVLNKFPRIVRDLSLAVGKKVNFEVGGHDTELDRSLLEAIRDPLTHMIRNAIDHGIEDPETRVAAGKSPTGHLQLRACHEGGKVVIEIQDDGRGVNIERVREKALSQGLITPEVAARMNHNDLLKLIFLPGFSTTDKVTQFSGRGVGMDVVRTNIERIGGTVDIESQLGQGTTVRTKIPLTLAIIPALVIHHSGERYAIPQVNLLELVRLTPDQVRTSVSRIQETPVYRLRGSLLPLVFLDEQLMQASSQAVDSDWNIVVVQADDRPFGIVVDAIRDTEEIVVKPLHKQIKALAPFAGATIMGDGRVALVLDVMSLAQRAGILSRDVMRAWSRSEESEESQEHVETPQLLICETRRGDRLALVLQQVARLETFQLRELERVGNHLVVQYRDAILPLLDVSSEVAGEPPLDVHPCSDEISVIVFAAGPQPVGLIVGRIVDIVTEPLGNCLPSSRPGVLYSAVILGRVTEFLDAIELVQSTLKMPLSRGRLNPLLQSTSRKSSDLT